MRCETVFTTALFATVLSPSFQGDLGSFKWSTELIDWSKVTEYIDESYKLHNAGEFETLCKIYRITQVEAPQPSFENREKEGEIMNKLEEMVKQTAAGGNKGSSDSSNSTTAYQEMKKLFEKVKKLKEEIEVNRTKALYASRSAEDNMLRAVYGDAVDVARNENKTLEQAMRGNKSLLFNNVDNAGTSCGSYGDKLVGKTLINDFFCLCVGEAIGGTGSVIEKKVERGDVFNTHIYNGFNCLCKDEMRRPRNGSWTMMADSCNGDSQDLCDPKNVKYNHTDAWDVISKACVYKNVASNVKTLKSALAQFDDLVNLEQTKYQVKGILGYVKTENNTNHICTGHTVGFTCVSYNHTLENGGIPWYNHLTNATEQLQEMDKYAKEADNHLHELEEYQHEAEEIFLEVKLGDAELWRSNRACLAVLGAASKKPEKPGEPSGKAMTLKGAETLCNLSHALRAVSAKTQDKQKKATAMVDKFREWRHRHGVKGRTWKAIVQGLEKIGVVNGSDMENIKKTYAEMEKIMSNTDKALQVMDASFLNIVRVSYHVVNASLSIGQVLRDLVVLFEKTKDEKSKWCCLVKEKTASLENECGSGDAGHKAAKAPDECNMSIINDMSDDGIFATLDKYKNNQEVELTTDNSTKCWIMGTEDVANGGAGSFIVGTTGGFVTYRKDSDVTIMSSDMVLKLISNYTLVRDGYETITKQYRDVEPTLISFSEHENKLKGLLTQSPMVRRYFKDSGRKRRGSVDDDDVIDEEGFTKRKQYTLKYESVRFLSCLSNALNKLYTDGEQRLFVNEEVYANASRILDDMEGKTGESTTYLSVFSSSMGEQNDKLEKLISYGNEMGDLVAKVGGLFAEVNESVREVRNELPNTLIKATKYYTAIAEITKTVWNDVKAVGLDSDMAKCNRQEFSAVENFEASCGDQTCPLENSVTEGSLQKYKDGCLTITILNGYVSECLNRLRDSLYRSGAVQSSRKILEWRGEYRHGAFYFQLTLEIQQIFSTLITSFAAGKPPFALLDMMANITSLNSHFNWVHGNFTSLLLDIDVAGNVSNTNSTILQMR